MVRRFHHLHQKSYKNPFFHKSKSSFYKKTKIASFIIAFLFLFYLIFFSPIFYIQSIEINNQDNTEQVQNYVLSKMEGNWGLIPERHIFVPKDKLEKEIKKEFNFAKVVIDKRLFTRKIIIKIQEREPFIVVKHGARENVLDQEGIILNKEGGENLPILYVEGNETEPLNPNNEFLRLISLLNKEFPKETGIAVSLFRTVPDFSILSVDTIENWTAIFDPNKDITEQLNKLVLLLRTTLQKAERSKLQYIDVRFADRIYYK